MILTNKQEQALKIAIERYKNHEAYTCISGYAGTGKSTLVPFIIEALNLHPDNVCYIAYTGKASLVLKEKGCSNAMTAHRLLYQAFPRDDGTFYYKIRRPIDPWSLIVVDEVSMLPKEMWELLLSHNIPVLALGDPGQLPPIGDPNGVLDHPHIFLDEIVRQAQESEIIRLTMDIRNGKILKPTCGSEVQIVRAKDLVDGMYYWADQIICATNQTRRQINAEMRSKLLATESPRPMIGDKVICLKNNWDEINEAGDCLVNGLIGTLTSVDTTKSNPWLNPMMKASFVPNIIGNEALFASDNDTFHSLNMDYKIFTEGEPTVTKDNFKKFPRRLRPNEFDYGYAITCWKSQGSEYGKILLLEERFPFAAEDHKKYLYTGATRAKDKLVIVTKN